MNVFIKGRKNCFIFLILLGVYFVVTLFLFHMQTGAPNGNYISDIQPYIVEIQGISSGYNYPYPIMFWIAKVFMLVTKPAHAMAITVASLNALTAVVLKYYFDRQQWKDYWWFSTFLVFASLFVSMLFPLSYLGRYVELSEGLDNFLYRYLGAFSPNPFHNATYLAARPFAVVAFFMGVDILKEYEDNTKWLRMKYVLFGMVLLVATMTKPSFTLVMVCACWGDMLWRLFRNGMKGMKALLQFGIYFIPTFLDLLYQYRDVFVGVAGEEEKGIGVGFLTAWGTATDNVLVSILLGIAFPISVLLFQRLRLSKNDNLRFAWLFYVVSLVMLMFFYEKGYRLDHVNFAWGYMYGMFFLFVSSLLALTKETLPCSQPLWQLILQWGIFALHLICGLDYFRVMLCGGFYY